MDDWRSSAARVGADEALMYVLSWYEGLNLDALKTLRDGSKWLTDPDYVQRRQEFAHSLIQYAPVHSFVPGERVPQREEIPERFCCHTPFFRFSFGPAFGDTNPRL